MKTAVETLFDRIEEIEFIDPAAGQFYKEVISLKEQAKAMEKEQIIESWDNGYANGYDLGKHDDQPNPDDAEQYYNETFKSE